MVMKITQKLKTVTWIFSLKRSTHIAPLKLMERASVVAEVAEEAVASFANAREQSDPTVY